MDEGLKQMCPHCRSVGVRRLGECSVCHHIVCEHCGNAQFANGERRIAHNACLRQDEGAFRMIKFVR